MIPFAASFPLEDVWFIVFFAATMGTGLALLWVTGHLNLHLIRLKVLPFAVVGGLGAALTEDPVEDWYESRYSVCVQVASPSELGQMAGVELWAECRESRRSCSCRYGDAEGRTAGRLEIDAYSWGDESAFDRAIREAPPTWSGVQPSALPYGFDVQLFQADPGPRLYVELRGGGLLELQMPEGVSDEEALAFTRTVVERKHLWSEFGH